jgi:hypothetical protein
MRLSMMVGGDVRARDRVQEGSRHVIWSASNAPDERGEVMGVRAERSGNGAGSRLNLRPV